MLRRLGAYLSWRFKYKPQTSYRVIFRSHHVSKRTVDLWGTRPCSLVGGYGYFSGTRCFHFHGISRASQHTGIVPNIAPIKKQIQNQQRQENVH